MTNLNKDKLISIKYKIPPLSNGSDVFCYCNGAEFGLMLECTKCRNWFHQECINLSKSEISEILLYYCDTCVAANDNLRIIYKDFAKEHTKPLFNSYKILTIHNLYTYHTLLELYKLLKFRTPYCVYEIFNSFGERQMDLNLHLPQVSLQCQKQSFTYQAIILWNKFYKKLIVPFTITLHHEYIRTTKA